MRRVPGQYATSDRWVRRVWTLCLGVSRFNLDTGKAIGVRRVDVPGWSMGMRETGDDGMSDHDLCPWWMGYFLASPLRRLYQNPERILADHVKAGMVALDVGSAMGFFTLPMARLVGESGRVIAVDLQEKMLRSLRRRALRAGISGRIETRTCPSTSLGIDDLEDHVDFALAFAVLHEMPEIKVTLAGIYRSLRHGGRLLVAEPSGHVTVEEFARTTATAKECGFEVISTPSIRSSRSVLLAKR